MELQIRNGDYVPDGIGGLRKVDGTEALVQRILFRLTARRGKFSFRKNLGSRLWQLGHLPVAQRQAAAKQFVAEALEEERGLEIRSVALTADGQLTVELTYEDMTFAVTLEVQGVT